MTLDEQRANAHGCWDLAIAELRARLLAECRVPIAYHEVEAALSRAARRLPAARPGDDFPGSEI